MRVEILSCIALFLYVALCIIILDFQWGVTKEWKLFKLILPSLAVAGEVAQ